MKHESIVQNIQTSIIMKKAEIKLHFCTVTMTIVYRRSVIMAFRQTIGQAHVIDARVVVREEN